MLGIRFFAIMLIDAEVWLVTDVLLLFVIKFCIIKLLFVYKQSIVQYIDVLKLGKDR